MTRRHLALVGGSVAALVVAAGLVAIVGDGEHGSTLRLLDGGAWLADERSGWIVHVNGASAAIDASVQVAAPGEDVDVAQSADAVYVTNVATRSILRVDPARLETRRRESSAGEIVAGREAVFAVDSANGLVQQIDPSTLAPIGAEVVLDPTLSRGVVDADERLWVGSSGSVVSVRAGSRGLGVRVGEADQRVEPGIVDGRAVAVNLSEPEAVEVGDYSSARRYDLGLAPGTGVAMPTVSRDGAMWLTSEVPAQLLRVDTATALVHRVALPAGGDFGEPQVLETTVYVPEFTGGSLLAFDRSTGAERETIDVTGPGASEFESFVRDGRLWVNDPDGSAAFVVDERGARVIDKDVPGARAQAVQATQPPPAPGPGAVSATRVGGDSSTRGPLAEAIVPSGDRRASPSSAPQTTTTTAPPVVTPPLAFQILSSPNEFRAGWVPPILPTGFALLGYQLWRRDGSTGAPEVVPRVIGPDETSVVIGDFALCASGLGSSLWSLSASYDTPAGARQTDRSTEAVLGCPVPTRPENVVAWLVSPSPDTVVLTFDGSDGGQQSLVNVFWDGSQLTLAPSPDPQRVVVGGLAELTPYSFLLQWCNNEGCSADSAPATVTTGFAGTVSTDAGATDVVSGPCTPTVDCTPVGSRANGERLVVECQASAPDALGVPQTWNKVVLDTEGSLSGSRGWVADAAMGSRGLVMPC